jgi:2-methylcitrate dehydratase PrpD
MMTDKYRSSPVEQIAANVLETRFGNFDQVTVENAKNRIIDVLGCVISGANAPGNPGLVDLVRDWGGKGETTILIHGGKAPAHNVAMLTSIMARSFEFEPACILVDNRIIPSHLSGTTVTTTLAMGEAKRIDGEELITAMLVGDDVAARLLAGSGFGSTRGFDAIGTVNMFGATAIAGRILGLNRLQMRNAFGLVLNQLAGSFQNVWDGTTAFKLLQGLSARNGIFSAQLAKSGWTGPEDALLSPFGYYNLYTEGCSDPEILTKDLGKKYYSDTSYKPHPCCGLTHPAIDCALSLVKKHDVQAQDIKEVVLYVFSGGFHGFGGQRFIIGDYPYANAVFNFRYTVANALLRKSVKIEHFSEESILDPQLHALINKINLVELPGAEFQSSKLKLIMKGGKEFSESCDAPKGDPLRNPLSKDEIIAKFWGNVEYSRTVSAQNANKLLRLLGELEGLDNVNKIVELLV